MRDRIISAIIYTAFTLLTTALLYIQIIRFPYYHKLARNNVIRIIPIDGPRGNMFDTKGIALVSNRLSFDVAVVYQELQDTENLIKVLTETLGVASKDILKSIELARRKPYAPVTIIEDVDKEKALMLEEASLDIRGLVIETRSKRNYIYQDMASHVFGYLSEISEYELEKMRGYGYRMRDLIGKDGLEKIYDRYLAGVDGGLQIEVDSKGRLVKTLGLKEPSSGKDLYLTIDLSLQAVSDKLLGERKGAVIVMNPQNGAVLALASHPAFDPNIFVKPDTSRERMMLVSDRKGRPLFNRAISGMYPPGSVFKITVASAALSTKRVTPNTRFNCTGSYNLGGVKFDCWKDTGHGSQNITEGLMNSCNVFFYNTGKATGVDNIETYTRVFGFGAHTGVDLPDEAKGVVPGKLWKRLHKHDNWYEGDTLNYSIGQGYLLVTPIQIVEMTSVIANGGNIVTPHLVKKIGTDDMEVPEPSNIGLRNEAIQTVREGLYKVVNSDEGTGKHVRVEGLSIAGKTGTAQNPQGRTHAWFTGFAPFNVPKISLVVFLEHGGKGGLEPAEIAKGIFQEAKNRGYL